LYNRVLRDPPVYVRCSSIMRDINFSPMFGHYFFGGKYEKERRKGD
jgi:hypothetical protein